MWNWNGDRIFFENVFILGWWDIQYLINLEKCMHYGAINTYNIWLFRKIVCIFGKIIHTLFDYFKNCMCFEEIYTYNIWLFYKMYAFWGNLYIQYLIILKIVCILWRFIHTIFDYLKKCMYPSNLINLTKKEAICCTFSNSLLTII